MRIRATLVFGLAVSTFLVLLVVPAMMAIGNDIAFLLGRRKEREPAPQFRVPSPTLSDARNSG